MSGPLQKNIPQPGDLISDSQQDLLQNSQYWVDSLAKDHKIVNGDTSGTSFEGRHLQVSLEDKGTAAVAMPGDGEDSIIFSNGQKLYFRSTNANITSGIQLTPQNASWNATNAMTRFGTAGAITNGNGGWTFLPGRLLLQYGYVTSPGSSGTVTYPIPFGSGGVYSITLTAQIAAASLGNAVVDSAGTVDASQFSYKITVQGGMVPINPTFLYWMAIGQS